MLTFQELLSSMQKEVESNKCVKSLAHNTQVFKFPRLKMMRPPQICLNYEALNMQIPTKLEHLLLLLQA